MRLITFVLLFLYIIPQLVKQSQGISSGLVRLYRQSIVPFVVGNEFRAVAIQSDNPNVIYLGMEHGIYRHGIGKDKPEDMTDEELRAAAKATMPRDARGRFA